MVGDIKQLACRTSQAEGGGGVVHHSGAAHRSAAAVRDAVALDDRTVATAAALDALGRLFKADDEPAGRH